MHQLFLSASAFAKNFQISFPNPQNRNSQTQNAHCAKEKRPDTTPVSFENKRSYFTVAAPATNNTHRCGAADIRLYTHGTLRFCI